MWGRDLSILFFQVSSYLETFLLCRIECGQMKIWKSNDDADSKSLKGRIVTCGKDGKTKIWTLARYLQIFCKKMLNPYNHAFQYWSIDFIARFNLLLSFLFLVRKPLIQSIYPKKQYPFFYSMIGRFFSRVMVHAKLLSRWWTLRGMSNMICVFTQKLLWIFDDRLNGIVYFYFVFKTNEWYRL